MSNALFPSHDPGGGLAIIPINAYINMSPGASANTATTGLTIGHKALDTNYYWTKARFWPNGTYDGKSALFPQDASSKGRIRLVVLKI